MSGTLNPLYGGSNMNGVSELGAGDKARNLAQGHLESSMFGTRDPIRGLTEHAAASVYKNSLSADEIVTGLKGITDTIKTTSTFTSDKISSIIFTVMQALSNSFTGGMNGMKAELEKISSEQEDSGDNAMVEFLTDCGSFLNFFIQYTTVNKQLQYKITHPDDDDLLAPQQKAYIKDIKKQLDDETEFPDKDGLIYDNESLQKQIINPTTYFYDVTTNPPKWVIYEYPNKELSEEKKGISKQRKQYLKKLNNIELEFYQEKLNNAFQYLTFTYGQLSGRTLYNLSKLLAAGGAKDVGLFAPISLGSLSGSAMRMVPGAGPVIDTVNDFFSAFSTAFKMSYKTLKQERDLASDYIQNNIELSKNLNLKGGEREQFIKKDTFKKLIKPSHEKNEGKKESRKNKQYNTNANQIAEGRVGKSTVHVPEFSKVRAESDLKLLNEILSDYYHVDSLMELIKIIGEDQVQGQGNDSIYIGDGDSDEKKLLKLQKITTNELEALRSKSKGKFVKLYKALSKTIQGNTTISQHNTNSIELNNPVLYGIVKDFIKTTYENLGQEEEKNEEEKNEEEEEKEKKKEIKKSLVGLIDKLESTSHEIDDINVINDINKTIEDFLSKQQRKKKEEEKLRKDSLNKDKKQLTAEQIEKLTEIIQEEKNRIEKNAKTENAETENAETEDAKTDIPSSIENYKEIIEQNLQHYNDELLAKIGAEIVASNSFKPLKKLVSSYQKLLKSGVKKIIDDFKAEYNKDAKNDAKNDEQNKQLIYIAFDKLLKFIDIKNFEAVNTGLDKIEDYIDTKMKKNPPVVTAVAVGTAVKAGGGMRSSTIKRRIKKATRRIQLSLDEFNSGRNTRRGRYRKKPRNTRRVNYGH